MENPLHQLDYLNIDISCTMVVMSWKSFCGGTSTSTDLSTFPSKNCAADVAIDFKQMRQVDPCSCELS